MMHSFHDVSVSFPTGASAFHTRGSQASNWVPWSIGELRVDSSTYALVFAPAGSKHGNFASKPLGCVKSASPLQTEDGSAAFVVSTNDAVHGNIRMGFPCPKEAEMFMGLAKAAEAVSGNNYFGAGRRSSVSFGAGRASMAPSRNGELDELCARIADQHPTVCPLNFRGVELYGPDPNGDAGSEVIIVRGVLVLLDPQESGRVGQYELLIYEESNFELAMRCPIGPRMQITPDAEIPESHRRQSRRLSMRAACTVFNFSVNGEAGWSLAFDESLEAAAFLRDFRVRHKLMALSCKTSSSLETVSFLRGELSEWQRWGVAATLRTWLFQAFVLVLLAVLLHASSLHYLDPERPFIEAAMGALRDASSTATALFGLFQYIGESACQTISRGIPARAVETCASLPSCGEVRACVNELALGRPGL